MTIAAIVAIGIWFLALLEVAQEGRESWWTRMNRAARRRAKDLL